MKIKVSQLVPDSWLTHAVISSGTRTVQSHSGKLYGMDYWFVVCHSSQLQSRKAEAIDDQIGREKEMALKSMKDFERIDFYCLKDAEEAVNKSEKDLRVLKDPYFFRAIGLHLRYTAKRTVGEGIVLSNSLKGIS